MARVIIFGVADFAALAHFYLQHDTKHEVVAFSVSAEYMPADGTFEGLPVVAFEEVERKYPASDYAFFAPMSHRKMNRLRETVYKQIKAKEYQLISYVSSRATVWPEAKIGDNCFILEDNTLQPYTPIGNNVVLWSCIVHLPRCTLRPLHGRAFLFFRCKRHHPRRPENSGGFTDWHGR
jgi:UDP-3-O-[3-hydroxymyristoyl] glucosamine N-acyltransferase